MRLIVLTSHTLLSPQSCHAYPAPLSQRNITVSYNWGRRRGGGGTESSNFLKVDWQMQLYEVCRTIKKKKKRNTHRGSFKTIHIHHAHFRTMRFKKKEKQRQRGYKALDKDYLPDLNLHRFHTKTVRASDRLCSGRRTSL